MGVGPFSVSTKASAARHPTGPMMKFENLSAVKNGTTEGDGV